MIEVVGYITLYLLAGVIMLPFAMLVDKMLEADKKRKFLFTFIIGWPVTSVFSIFVILIVGWTELKNYK